MDRVSESDRSTSNPCTQHCPPTHPRTHIHWRPHGRGPTATLSPSSWSRLVSEGQQRRRVPAPIGAVFRGRVVRDIADFEQQWAGDEGRGTVMLLLLLFVKMGVD